MVKHISGGRHRGQHHGRVEREIAAASHAAVADWRRHRSHLELWQTKHRHQVAIARRRECITRLRANKSAIFRPIQESIRQAGCVRSGCHRYRQAFTGAASASDRATGRRCRRYRDVVVVIDLEIRLHAILFGKCMTTSSVFIQHVARIGRNRHHKIPWRGGIDPLRLRQRGSRSQRIDNPSGWQILIHHHLPATGVEHLHAGRVTRRSHAAAAIGKIPANLPVAARIRTADRQIFHH